jgi:hypothetical protein
MLHLLWRNDDIQCWYVITNCAYVVLFKQVNCKAILPLSTLHTLLLYSYYNMGQTQTGCYKNKCYMHTPLINQL